MYEDVSCSLLEFMQNLEEIVKYIDNFTCGGIAMDVNHSFVKEAPRVASTKSIFYVNEVDRPKTSSVETGIVLGGNQDASLKHDVCEFKITRENGLSKNKIRIKISLTDEDMNKDTKVIECFSLIKRKKKVISNNVTLRDSICAELAPTMNIFPYMSRLLMNSLDMKPTPLTNLKISGILPRLGMRLDKGETKSIFIFLDDEDKIVTVKKYESEKEEKLYWDNDLFQISTYILGNHLIGLPD